MLIRLLSLTFFAIAMLCDNAIIIHSIDGSDSVSICQHGGNTNLAQNDLKNVVVRDSFGFDRDHLGKRWRIQPFVGKSFKDVLFTPRFANSTIQRKAGLEPSYRLSPLQLIEIFLI